ncbi:MAG TPA: cohesin domain-containing protein [Bryobacteraceae bacterium]|nr:cohesin domain-containing protein [Bryobacteraceae bacterium]
MSFFNRLVAVFLTAILLAPVTPIEAKTKKGDQYFTQGRALEAKKDWDGALAAYQKALSEDPSDLLYQMATEKTRFQASQMHVDKGFKQRAQGLLAQALSEFQKAYALDPASAVAEQEIRNTQQMIERVKKQVEQTGKEPSAEERALTPAQQEEKETDDKLSRMLSVPELKPINPQPLNLKINNQPPKVLFETVAKLAGINVLWDPDYAVGKNQSVDFINTPLEEALDNIALITKSFWQPLSSNTIFITNDNPTKRRDYEQQVMKVFYLSNVSTQPELNEMVNAVRTVADCSRIFPYSAQNAIIARCEADRIALAQKIIDDLDKPKAEVVVDIIVMEASKVYSRKITTAIASTGLNVPIAFTPRTGLQIPITPTTPSATGDNGETPTTPTEPSTPSTPSTTPAIPLANLGHLSSADYSVILPDALLQAIMSDAGTKVLQAPEIRSVDNVKASIKIGEREPTATGSFQPGIGGVGINPLVNTQFQYLDVGVNVEITPRIHEDGDVSLHVDLDISSVTGTVNLGGIDQPIIGQRKVSHDIRLKNGEVNLLGGLVNQQESKTVTGIPGLSSIPIIRRLFTGESVDRNRDELMIALIPHIVRQPTITADNLRGVASGTTSAIKVSYAPAPVPPAKPGTPAAAAPAVQVPPATAPVTPPATAPATATPPATAPPATAPPATAPPGPPPPPPATAPPATAPTTPMGNAHVYFLPAQVSTTAGSTVNVALVAQNATDVMSAPLQVQFDPRILRLNDVTLGDFMSRGGPPVFTKNIMNDTGTATIQLSAAPGTRGASGSGIVVTLNFQAVAAGATAVSVPNIDFRNSQGQTVATGTAQLSVNVK